MSVVAPVQGANVGRFRGQGTLWPGRVEFNAGTKLQYGDAVLDALDDLGVDRRSEIDLGSYSLEGTADRIESAGTLRSQRMRGILPDPNKQGINFVFHLTL